MRLPRREKDRCAVEAPCALLIEAGGRTVLRLADPTQERAGIGVRLDGAAFEVALPGELYAGSTTTFRLSR